MLDTPRIMETVHQHTGVIHITVPRHKMREVMGPGVQELMAGVAAQGVKPSGALFDHHFRIQPDIFDFELGVPVASPVKAAGRVKPSQWPAMKLARAVYRGPYEGLSAAWAEFDEWIKTNKLSTTDDIWQSYARGPESSPDPADWATELNRQLRIS